MNNSDNSISNSINKINKLYDKLSYFDLYGSSVLCFILITIILFLVYSYSVVMINALSIKNDWVNQRCNPKVIPFAGFIFKPKNKSAIEFTGENFNFCIQDILQQITGFAVQPFTFLLSYITNIFNQLGKAINIIRDFFAKLRTNFTNIAENILSRILNMLIPMQQILIALQDSFSKGQAILTAGLYTALGSYYTLQSLLGGITNLIIEILIIMASMIIMFFIIPFTIPMAITMSGIFLAISIPLAIIVVFMTQVLHIRPDLGIPDLPRPPSCFDKNTKIKMLDGSYKSIENMQCGDILYNNVKITAKMRLNAKDSIMYELNGIIVSGSHRVFYENKWIFVKDYPCIKPILNYSEPYLFCLNTTSKTIIINDFIFCDWDELYDCNLEQILNCKITNKLKHNNNLIIKETNNIHFYIDNGFTSDTIITLENGISKCINQIEIGDILVNNDVVYGTVEIDATDLSILPHEYLGSTKLNNKVNKLYHLFTNSKKINIGPIVYGDYNSLIDLKLIK